MNKRIYLDHNASSVVDPEVAEVIGLYLQKHFGNPSSLHSFGKESRGLLIKSRDEIANYLHVKSDEIIFTSGATEGANLVIQGILRKYPTGHIITTQAEHSCVYYPIKALEDSGFEVTYLSTGEFGAVSPEAVTQALRPNTKLIAIMAANNETGVKTNTEAVASIAKTHGIPFFVDGVALLGKEKVMVHDGISAMCFSGHKIHAPQGIGFCFIKRNFKLTPLFSGGGQQFGRRPGTENIPGIVGLAKAMSLLENGLPQAAERMQHLRDRFEVSLQNNLEDITINGKGPRVVNTSNLCFSGLDGESLLTALDMAGVAASHGSACESGAVEPSRALLDMGLSRNHVNSSLRFSLSRYTTDEDIDQAIEIISTVVRRLRSYRK